MFNSRSLSSKVAISISFLVILSLSGFAIVYFSLSGTSQAFKDLLDTSRTLESNFLSIRNNINASLRYENMFLANKDEESLAEFEKNTKLALSSIDELISLNEKFDLVHKDVSAETRSHMIEYIDSAKQAFDFVRMEGTPSTGVLGELRKQAHAFEEVVKQTSSPSKDSALVYYLMLRRHEKDYLARRKAKYIKKAQDERKNIAQFLEKDRGFNQTEKNKMKDAFDSYVEEFSKLSEYYNQRTASLEQASKAVLEVENHLTQIHNAIEKRAESAMKSTERVNLISTIIVSATSMMLILCSGVILAISQKISRRIIAISKSISQSNNINRKSSQTLQESSQKLSSSVAEQASAVQETVASLNEISAMVNRSVESTEKATEKTKISLDITHEVENALLAMRSSVNHITDLMKKLDTFVSNNREQMEEITKIIGNIVQKTSVINDIVFQTKLLSFNASVEAARAGDQGKGFAVVAEEVGVLANQSGQASKEITTLLSESKSRIENIVFQSNQQFSTIMADCVKEVSESNKLSVRCEEIQRENLDHVTEVEQEMKLVMTASKEQSEGIDNISIAMNEIDQSTSENSDIAHHTSSCSDSLNTESIKLDLLVKDLEKIILGHVLAGSDAEPEMKVSDPAGKLPSMGVPDKDDSRFDDVA